MSETKNLLKSLQVAFADRLHIDLFPDHPFRFFSHLLAAFGRFEHLSDSTCQAIGVSVLEEIAVLAFHDQVAFRTVAYGTKDGHTIRHGIIDRKPSHAGKHIDTRFVHIGAQCLRVIDGSDKADAVCQLQVVCLLSEVVQFRSVSYDHQFRFRIVGGYLPESLYQ